MKTSGDRVASLVLLVGVALAGACGSSSATTDAAIVGDTRLFDAGGPDATVAACPALADKHARADRALEGFLLQFWSGGDQYLRAEVPGSNLSAYWVYAQAFDALLDGVERTRGAHFAGLVASFARGQEQRGWSSDYYDDENWLALALVRAFDLTGETRYLVQAEALFHDIQSAWDPTCCGSSPGGIWWDRAHTQKATASNAGPVITAVRLWRRTGNSAYLDFAHQAYDYWTAHMVDAASHQVADHIGPDGTITRWRFTYNEGLMIGAALALHDVHGDARYLDDARAIAGFMITSETVPTALGPVLSDGPNDGCLGDCQQFKGIGYRYLNELDQIAPAPALEAVLSASAESAWTIARDPATGRFGTDWAAAPPGGTTSIMQMSAAIMALALDAERCGAYPGAATPTRFEAEDGAVGRIGLEANGQGYSGWGYLAGWNGDGQGVELHVRVASAGSYALRFRYAAAAGDATRRLAVNGLAPAPLPFAATSAWDAYADVPIAVDLPAGPSTLVVDFDAASGSKGYVNLDFVDVLPAP